MAKHQFTEATHKRLTAEFADLSTRARFEIADKIERAREMGDLKENGDYHAAKDEQGFLEGRIRELEFLLTDAEVFPPLPEGVVGLGTIVTIVYDGDDDSDSEQFLIGSREESVEGWTVLSPSSPLGSSLLGAKKGATVSYDAPNGKLKVKVLDTESAQ